MNDLLLALRQLRKHPGFTAVAVLMLALGIGANSVVFSVAKTILYRPLGVEDAEKLAWVRWILPETTGREDNLSWRDLGDLRAGLQSFHALALFYSSGAEWVHENKMEELSALNVTPSLGEVLGVRPVIGRLLQEEDAEDAAALIEGLDLAPIDLDGRTPIEAVEDYAVFEASLLKMPFERL